mmetsp:Transcript_96483/g.189460  ORF Transcript_96483/g.189460 Transcript_96483/m.189460 type:complete len:270 (-) Transcript_96483:385-1194(-)
MAHLHGLDDQPMTTQTGPPDSDGLGRGQACRERRRAITALDMDVGGLDEPNLTFPIEVDMTAVEPADMWIAPYQAIPDLDRWPRRYRPNGRLSGAPFSLGPAALLLLSRGPASLPVRPTGLAIEDNCRRAAGATLAEVLTTPLLFGQGPTTFPIGPARRAIVLWCCGWLALATFAEVFAAPLLLAHGPTVPPIGPSSLAIIHRGGRRWRASLSKTLTTEFLLGHGPSSLPIGPRRFAVEEGRRRRRSHRAATFPFSCAAPVLLAIGPRG